MKVNEIMSVAALRSCTAETKLNEAAKIMRAGNCGALPVVDSNNRVIGLITDRDICLAIAKDHGKPAIESHVRDCMSSQVFTVFDDDELEVALGKMRTNHIGRLPVVDHHEKLKGMLTLHDLLVEFIDEGKLIFPEDSPSVENVIRTIKALSDRYFHQMEVTVAERRIAVLN